MCHIYNSPVSLSDDDIRRLRNRNLPIWNYLKNSIYIGKERSLLCGSSRLHCIFKYNDEIKSDINVMSIYWPAYNQGDYLRLRAFRSELTSQKVSEVALKDDTCDNVIRQALGRVTGRATWRLRAALIKLTCINSRHYIWERIYFTQK